MRDDTYTLVHRPRSLKSGTAGAPAGSKRKSRKGIVGQIPSALQSVLSKGFMGEMPTLLGIATHYLSAPASLKAVGIWDIDADIAYLPEVIAKMNAIQRKFVFFDVQAAVPAGMVSRPEGVIAWARERFGVRLSKKQQAELSDNVIDEDFFDRANTVRKDLKLAYLIGLTRSKVAWAEGKNVNWNYFTSSDEQRLSLVSAYDLDRYAREAKMAIEAAVAYLCVGQLLMEVSPELGYHRDTGCLFDFNENRDNLIKCLREPHICDVEECRANLAAGYKRAAHALLDAIANYSRKG